MATVGWAQISAFQDVATAGSGAINAAVFFDRAARSRGPRRAAALLLAGVFIAITAGALGGLVSGPAAFEAALRGPLLVANLAVTAVVTTRARR